MMDQMSSGKTCNCPHHKALPVLVVLFGLLFLLSHYEVVPADFVSVAWPVLVILAGLKKMFSGYCKCC